MDQPPSSLSEGSRRRRRNLKSKGKEEEVGRMASGRFCGSGVYISGIVCLCLLLAVKPESAAAYRLRRVDRSSFSGLRAPPGLQTAAAQSAHQPAFRSLDGLRANQLNDLMSLDKILESNAKEEKILKEMDKLKSMELIADLNHADKVAFRYNTSFFTSASKNVMLHPNVIGCQGHTRGILWSRGRPPQRKSRVLGGRRRKRRPRSTTWQPAAAEHAGGARKVVAMNYG
ncbi:unnamed protein product [Sphagnum tenellum]